MLPPQKNFQRKLISFGNFLKNNGIQEEELRKILTKNFLPRNP